MEPKIPRSSAMILIYAFSNRWGTNISRRVLSEMQHVLTQKDIFFLPVFFFPKSFFHKYIESNQYSVIIGLGDGSRMLTKIKIETQARNNYNEQVIYPFSPIFLDLNLPSVDNFDSEYFQIGSNMGTYNCNWLAYKTQLNLNQHHPQTKHLFLHLPQKSNASIITSKVVNLLLENHVI
jgi:pyrrolidone-carboxylate peptidase